MVPSFKFMEFLDLMDWELQVTDTSVWGMYFDETSRDEQISDSRVPRTGIFCRSRVAEFREQVYLAKVW